MFQKTGRWGRGFVGGGIRKGKGKLKGALLRLEGNLSTEGSKKNQHTEGSARVSESREKGETSRNYFLQQKRREGTS